MELCPLNRKFTRILLIAAGHIGLQLIKFPQGGYFHRYGWTKREYSAGKLLFKSIAAPATVSVEGFSMRPLEKSGKAENTGTARARRPAAEKR